MAPRPQQMAVISGATLLQIAGKFALQIGNVAQRIMRQCVRGMIVLCQLLTPSLCRKVWPEMARRDLIISHWTGRRDHKDAVVLGGEAWVRRCQTEAVNVSLSNNAASPKIMVVIDRNLTVLWKRLPSLTTPSVGKWCVDPFKLSS